MENLNKFIQELKEDFSSEDMICLLEAMNVSYRIMGDTIRARTCCHNNEEELRNAGYNLSINKDNFCTCFSQCADSFDFIELVRRTRRVRGLNSRIIPTLQYICEATNKPFDTEVKEDTSRYNWNNLTRYLKKGKTSEELQLYDESILECFDKVVYKDWEDEYITGDLQEKYNIRYYSAKEQIIVPVYNYAGLVGIRVRNLLPEIAEEYGKYRPLELLDGTTFKFPTGETLFGIDNIYQTDEVILVESEKAVMQLCGYGYKGVAMFGKNFTNTHLKLLLKAGVNKIVIGLDSDASDNDINKIITKCKPFLECYVIKNDLGEKTSPTDKGKQIFERLYNRKTKI